MYSVFLPKAFKLIILDIINRNILFKKTNLNISFNTLKLPNYRTYNKKSNKTPLFLAKKYILITPKHYFY